MTDDTPPRRKGKSPIKKIGGRTLKPSTLMMGHGYDPVLSEGALKPPIFLTSTFAFENAAAGKRFFEHITGCLLYPSPSPRDRTRPRMPSSA